MIDEKKISTTLGLFIIFFSLLLAGCGSVNKSSSEYVQERANLRWQALIKKDWNAAYQFQLPAYRQTHDLSQYMSKFGKSLNWKSVKINNARINTGDDTADVLLTLTYEVNLPVSGSIETSSPISERWMQDAGEWWVAD